jgi:hypothetical protein
MKISQVLETLQRTETHVDELVDRVKKLEAHLPATVLAAILDGLHNPETLKLIKTLVSGFYASVKIQRT